MNDTPSHHSRPRLKICCMASVEEARLAIACGADAVGLVGDMPSGPGPIPDDLIARIAVEVPPPIATFLLTSETEANSIIDHIRRTRVNIVQIVDDEVQPNVYGPIRDALPWIKIVQVIHVRDETSIEKAIRASHLVDALLLDSGNPSATIRELGGTGRVHNWDLSRQIVEQSSRPVFLAGGINAENIGSAIAAVRPYGIDLCSSVRQNGTLDRDKLMHFVKALSAASEPND